MPLENCERAAKRLGMKVEEISEDPRILLLTDGGHKFIAAGTDEVAGSQTLFLESLDQAALQRFSDAAQELKNVGIRAGGVLGVARPVQSANVPPPPETMYH